MIKIKEIYLWSEKIWFKFPQKIRFLLVGGFNTVVSWVILNLLNFALIKIMPDISKIIVANMALFIQYVLTINLSFITMRYYVFQSHGPFIKEWIKAVSTYVFMWGINAPVLSLMIDLLSMDLWLAQGIYLIFSTILIFILHKHYSFCEKKD